MCVHFDSIEVCLLRALFCLTTKLTISCPPYDVNVFLFSYFSSFLFFFFLFLYACCCTFLSLLLTLFFFLNFGLDVRQETLLRLYNTKIFKCQLIETVSSYYYECVYKIKTFFFHSFIYLFIFDVLLSFLHFILLFDHKMFTVCVCCFDCCVFLIKYKTLK